MKHLLVAAALLAPLAAHAHTRSSDPVALATAPPQIIQCAGQDATTAINAALANGGITHLSGGTCVVSGSLVMSVNGSFLNGAGAGQTIIKAVAPTNIDAIVVGGARRTQAASGVRIWGFTEDGSATSGSASGQPGSGVVVRSGSSAAIVSVELENNGGDGARFGGSGSIVHSYVHDNQHNGIYVLGVAKPGLPVIPAGPVTITGNRVQHNSLQHPPPPTGPGSTWDGIDCDPWHTGCDIEQNTVIGNDILLLDHSWWSGPDKIINNTIENSQEAGIDVADMIDTFTVSGNTITGTQAYSIIVGGLARNGSITGNTMTSSGPMVIHLTTSNVVQSGNVSN